MIMTLLTVIKYRYFAKHNQIVKKNWFDVCVLKEFITDLLGYTHPSHKVKRNEDFDKSLIDFSMFEKWMHYFKTNFS